jgi:hypothetical protein
VETKQHREGLANFLRKSLFIPRETEEIEGMGIPSMTPDWVERVRKEGEYRKRR